MIRFYPISYNKGIYKATLYKKGFSNSQNILLNYNSVKNIVFKYDGISNYVTEIRTGKKIPIIFINTNTFTQKTNVELPLKGIDKYPICVFFQTYNDIFSDIKNHKYFMDYFYNEYYDMFETSNSYNLLFHGDNYMLTLHETLEKYLNENTDKDKLMKELQEIERSGQQNLSANSANYKHYYSSELGKRQSTFEWHSYRTQQEKKYNKNKYYYVDYEKDIKDIDLQKSKTSKAKLRKKVISHDFVI